MNLLDFCVMLVACWFTVVWVVATIYVLVGIGMFFFIKLPMWHHQIKTKFKGGDSNE